MRPHDMAGAPPSGSSPDVSVLFDINGIAESTPPWFDRVAAFAGEYGIIALLVPLLAVCWWRVRAGARAEAGAGAGAGADSSGAVSALAALLWAPLAAVIAALVNIPIRGLVERPRPFVDHDGLEVLLPGTGGYSFVSDHTSVAVAVAVAVFIASRKFGLLALGLALLEGATRVYLGVHYPSDVVGGIALGTAVALLFAPLAIWALTPLVRRGPGWLVPKPGAGEGEDGDAGSSAQLQGAVGRSGGGDGELAA